MAIAKALGASRIIAVDVVPSRLEFTKSYVATQTFLPPSIIQGETKSAYTKRISERMKQELGIESYGPKFLWTKIN
jgi:D-xylulose reductase